MLWIQVRPPHPRKRLLYCYYYDVVVTPFQYRFRSDGGPYTTPIYAAGLIVKWFAVGQPGLGRKNPERNWPAVGDTRTTISPDDGVMAWDSFCRLKCDRIGTGAGEDQLGSGQEIVRATVRRSRTTILSLIINRRI